MIDDENILNLLRQMMKKDQKLKYMKRAAHAKSLGLVKAYFTVHPELPDAFRVGLFRDAKTYPAFIRFSNSNPKSTSDALKDVRGCAIKLVDDTQPDFPQDFILASCPTIPFGKLEEFYETMYWGLKNPIYLGFKSLFNGNLKKFIALYQMLHHDTSPLDIKYWSITPYALGEAAVKYTLMPTSAYHSALPKTLTSAYLSENMRRHLLSHEATFDFYIQPQIDEARMPIDDISIEWKASDSPLVKAAQIHIPPQNFLTDKRRYLSEALAYSPANSLKEHRALGAINEARVTLYQELSAFRHKKNHMPEIIPTEKDFDALQ